MSGSTRTAFIINPFSGRKVQFSNLFTSHPPTEDRVARLRSSADLSFPSTHR